jgi:hypothetical protein
MISCPLRLGWFELRHQVLQFSAGAPVLLEQCEVIDRSNMILCGQAADLIGLLVERVVRVVQVRGRVGCVHHCATSIAFVARILAA